jgi:tetratricopeptide (TPR) repeat protein
LLLFFEAQMLLSKVIAVAWLGFAIDVFRLTKQRAERHQRTAALRTSRRIPAGVVDDVVEFACASDTAADLVYAGKLDEAENAARGLLERFPHIHDGWDRLGMVYEARGNSQRAADCYRKVIELIRANPGDYDADFVEVFIKLVDKLDPPGG